MHRSAGRVLSSECLPREGCDVGHTMLLRRKRKPEGRWYKELTLRM